MQADAQHRGTVLDQNLLHILSTTPDPTDAIRRLLQVAKTLLNASDTAYCAFGASQICIAANDAQTFLSQYDLFHNFQLNHRKHAQFDFQQLPEMNNIAWHMGKDDLLIAAFEQSPMLHDDHHTQMASILDALHVAVCLFRSNRQSQRHQQLSVSILNSITDPLLVVDREQRILEMNTAAEIVFKTSHDLAKEKPLQEVVDSPQLMDLFQNPNQAEWVSQEEETFIPRTEPVYDSDGELQGWVLSLRDITRFKKLNRNQSEFTRMFSHDLRSPLTSMQGFANMLELQLVGELNEKQVHFVEKILAGIAQMTALVENIQDAGRFDPETGFYEMSRSACDVSEIVTRIVENHLVPAEKQELKLSTVLADNVPIINADAMMLERAITNLVDNAIKYTPNGGSVTVGVARVDNTLQVSVSDSGLGISPENQRQLFQRHVRIPRKEHKKIKGSGLGLFIVRSVAQHHGGEAWVESTEGRGSTFYMSIPLEGPNLLSQQ